MSAPVPDSLWPPPADDAEKAARVDALQLRVAGEAGACTRVAAFCTPATLERFTRAQNYDVDKAEAFLRRALVWRAREAPWGVTCGGCQTNPRAHSLRCVGTDAAGRPCLYHSFSQADGRHNAAHNAAHLVRLLEDCAAYMDAQEPQVEQWLWVFDFHGYGLWDNNPATVLAATQFLPLHPNRLFKARLPWLKGLAAAGH